MTFLTTDLEKISTDNSNLTLAEIGYNENFDTVSSATKSTITLGASASTILNKYADKRT